jgi:hypothetical protein
MYTVVLAFLSAGSSCSEQSDAESKISVEQKEKAHEILKQALDVAKKEPLILPSIAPSIAVVLARIDVDEALDVADEAYDPVIGSMTLGVIIFEAAKTNKDRVMEIFDRIIGVTDIIADAAKAPGGEEFATPALGVIFHFGVAPIIGAIAEIDAELALAIADKLKGDDFKEYMRWLVLAYVAGAIAGTDADRALDIASKIEDDSVKVPAYVYIADRLSESDKEHAQAVLDKAFEIIEKEDPYEIGFIFDAEIWMPPVLEAMVRINLDKSVSLVASIGRISDKARLQIVAEVAKTDVSKAIGIAEGELYPAQMLFQIGSVIAKTDPDKALAIADEIGKMNRQPTIEDFMREIPSQQDAKISAKYKLAIAEKIRKMKYVQARMKVQRAEIISAVAVEAAKEDKQKGLTLIKQAVGAAGEDTSILGQVAAMAAQIDADTAIEIAGNIENPSMRGLTLQSIVGAVAGRDPDKALTIAEKMETDSARAKALHVIASLVARTDPDKALTIAEKMETDSARAKALRVIASLVARTDPDKALMIAQNINEDYSKAGALCDIAEAILGIVERPASVEYAMNNLNDLCEVTPVPQHSQ